MRLSYEATSQLVQQEGYTARGWSAQGGMPPPALAKLPMHRVAAVASGNAAVPRQDQAKPIDFLKRLEQLEAESAAPSTNAPPSAAAMMPAWARNDPSGVVGGAPKFKSMKKRTNGEDAETILSQLNEIQVCTSVCRCAYLVRPIDQIWLQA